MKFWLFGLVLLFCVANVTAAHINHNASSINLVTGTYTAGNITSVWVFGDAGVNNTYNWSGVSATPGYDVRWNFSDVTADRNSYDFKVYGWTSVGGHIVAVDVYNFTGGSWDTFNSRTVAGWSWMNGTFYSQDYLSGNIVRVRAVHMDKGSPTEDFMIDFVRLTESDDVLIDPVEYERDTCPIESTASTMLYIWVGVILIGMAVWASYTSILFFSILVGLAGMVYAFPLFPCEPVFGLIVFLGCIFYLLYEVFFRRFQE